MASIVPALAPAQFLRSVDATRGTLGKAPMKLVEVVKHVRALTDDAPYAVIGGLAQILWARKSHTDDLDVVVGPDDIARALAKVSAGRAPDWAQPGPPDRTEESDEVFQVCHLLHAGAVVDLIAFKHAAFNLEIVVTAQAVAELGGVRFVRPELLLVMHLLRPGPEAALAAVELVIARRARGGLDLATARRWATEVGRHERLERVLAQAGAMTLV